MARVNGRKLVGLVMALTVVCLQLCDAGELCGISEDNLVECKPAVTAPNPTAPSAKCCTALESADLACLCGYKNSMELPLLGIDPALAVALPAKCGLTAPPSCA